MQVLIFAAGSQVQLLMRNHGGVHRHGLGDQPRVCAAQEFIECASFHLRRSAGHMPGYLGKSGLGGLVGFFQKRGKSMLGRGTGAVPTVRRSGRDRPSVGGSARNK